MKQYIELFNWIKLNIKFTGKPKLRINGSNYDLMYYNYNDAGFKEIREFSIFSDKLY